MTERPNLHCVEGTAALPLPVEFLDPLAYQSACVDGFVASQVARGFSSTTIDNGTGVLERFLSLAAKPAWELTASDVDAVVGALIDRGVGAVTRRGYVGTFKWLFTVVRPAADHQWHSRLPWPPTCGPPEGLPLVFQDYSRSLAPWMSVYPQRRAASEGAAFQGRAAGRRVMEDLESVGLGDRGDQYPWQMSGGMQQRVAIARGLASHPGFC